MKTIGLVVSRKENEKRRALVPGHIVRIKHPEFITIERGMEKCWALKMKITLRKGVRLLLEKKC